MRRITCAYMSFVVLGGVTVLAIGGGAGAAAHPESIKTAKSPSIAYVTHPNSLSAQSSTRVVFNGENVATVQPCTDPATKSCRVLAAISWSPDGKYLLITESVQFPKKAGYEQALIYNPADKTLKPLVRAVEASSFFPSWALDSDQIAYVASYKSTGGLKFAGTVDSITVGGSSHVLWRFKTGSQGCGGANPDPASNFFGGQADISVLQWTTKQQLAVFSPNCYPTGLDYVNTKTDVVKALDPKNIQLSEARLSSTGAVAAVSGTASLWGPVPSAHVVVGMPGAANWKDIGRGNEPVWSADGKKLYFDRQLETGKLSCGSGKNSFTVTKYRSLLLRAPAPGTPSTPIADEKIYGFGPVQFAPAGNELVFSRVTNDAHCGKSEFQITGAGVSIQSLTPGSHPVPDQSNAGLPAVRP